MKSKRMKKTLAKSDLLLIIIILKTRRVIGAL